MPTYQIYEEQLDNIIVALHFSNPESIRRIVKVIREEQRIENRFPIPPFLAIGGDPNRPEGEWTE